jgi:hypothetical protein
VTGPENSYILTCLAGADLLVPCEHLRSYLSMSGTSTQATGNFGVLPVRHFVPGNFVVLADRGILEILEGGRVLGA